MFPAQHNAMHPMLFQPWQSASYSETDAGKTGTENRFTEFPQVSSYQALEAHSAFKGIKEQFLSDIRVLKHLASNYVNQQYDAAINTFYVKLNDSSDHFGDDNLLLLYRDTRFRIHQLVSQLKRDHGTEHKDYIASVLHDCLNGIELCPSGVHSRFNSSVLNLEASRDGLNGKIFKARKDLFREFIQSFLFQQERLALIAINPQWEVHWFNQLHNHYCMELAIPPIDDPLVPKNLNDELVHRFLAAAPLSVNPCTILRRISAEWSDKLLTVLKQQGVCSWQTGSIDPTKMTQDIMVTLDTSVLKPLNDLLKTTGEKAYINLWTVIQKNNDGTYSMDRFREKLFAGITEHICRTEKNNRQDGNKVATVFAAIPGSDSVKTYIGTIDELYFWVFRGLHAGEECDLESDNQIPLELSHLTTLDFSSWPETTGYALLTQAMAQTNKARDIAAFFLDHRTRKQLHETRSPIIQALSDQLTEKLSGNSAFSEELCALICDHPVCSGTEPIPPEALNWLMDTPLSGLVLSQLRQRGADISRVTQRLNSWQISRFSQASIKNILTPNDSQRLFGQAFKLGQAETMSRLLLTGHCDDLTNRLNKEDEGPLSLFARTGVLPGLKYLLQLTGADVNHKNKSGLTPAEIAAQNGRQECLLALLQAQGSDGKTFLLTVAREGRAQYLPGLLNIPDIEVGLKDEDGLTPLHLAARHGHLKCFQELIKLPGIKVSDKTTRTGDTLLHLAAMNGDPKFLRELLKRPDIRAMVNEENDNRVTALNIAADPCGRKNNLECVEELFKVPGIQGISVSATLSDDSGNTKMYICTHDRQSYWLFDYDPSEHTEQADAGKTDSHTIIPLPSLNSNSVISISGVKSWDHVLIWLAKNTLKVKDIVTIFLHPAIIDQLNQTKQVTINKISEHIQDNLSHKIDNEFFKKLLCWRICDHWASSDKKNWSPKSTEWWSHTDLLVPVVSELYKRGINIPPVTSYICKEDALSLSPECLNKILLPGDCQRLFEGLFLEKYHLIYTQRKFRSCDLISRLLVTGHCDDYLVVSRISETLLNSFAVNNIVPGLKYLLKSRGTNVNQKRGGGWTLLHDAIKNQSQQVIQELLKREDFNVNARNNDGDTPLHIAAKCGNWEAVGELLKRPDLNVNEVNKEGWTALHCAASKGWLVVVHGLLTAQNIELNNTAPCKPYVRFDFYGSNKKKPVQQKSALMLAIENGHKTTAKVLIEDQRTAVSHHTLTAASKEGLTEIVNLLKEDPRVRFAWLAWKKKNAR